MKRASVTAVGTAGAGTGAALTATLASACCVGPSLAPLAVWILGAGGLVAVSALRPYAPYLLAAAALMLAFSFRSAYAQRSCVTRGVRFARFVTWIAAILWLLSLADSIYGFFHE